MRSLPAPIPTLQAVAVANCPAEVARFTPGESRTEAIVKGLERKTTISVQAYSLTSVSIAKALREAHTRGVRVEVILDRSNRTDKYSAADFLANQGVPTAVEALQSISLNK
jgi:phosphatidylserine/phosphatidylglycerophosphate/cardiolipin synthase-like enzyme